MIALVFPGQGSQYIGMGKEFFDKFEFIKNLFDKGEEITNLPLKRLCFEGPFEELTQTVNLQVSLTITNIACYEVLNSELEKKNIPVSFVAGHSLGEYSALYASKVLSLEDVLLAVKERGKLMDLEGKKSSSAMYAIIDFPLNELEKLVESKEDTVVISNYNSPKQFVISGKVPAVDEIAEKAKNLGAKKVIKLKVSAGFHSPLMKEAEFAFSKILNSLNWNDPQIPFVSNITGKEERSGETIKELMKKQITSPVRWIDCVEYMYNKGVKIFVEVGPKKVLSGLISQILEGKDFKCYNVENFETLENFLKNF
jgi:[acyl-carrier-protein] S-malonyltransferase